MMTRHAKQPYRMLAAMTLLSFIAMYILMYAMVDKYADVHANYNQAYMAALMAAPMPLIELTLMWAMYPERKWNIAIIVAGLVFLVGSFFAIRFQTGIGDTQFLKSMIPHHSGAILMCREADLSDAQTRQLCRQIIVSQQEEIDQMQARLRAIDETP